MNKSYLNATQQAAIYTDIGKLEIKEIPITAPKEDYCLIRVDICGICGSDLHNYRGNSLRTTFENWMKLGYADGHEYTGTVVSVGPEVSLINPGNRVVAECTRFCGVCIACKNGYYNVCVERKDLVWRGNGGFATYATAPESALHKIPDNVSPVQAALVEPAACALRAMNRAQVGIGDAILIVGAGSIGLLCAMLAKEVYNNPVSLVYKYKSQSDIANIIGIKNTIEIDNVSPEIAEIVIDAVGTGDSFNLALKGVKRMGRIVLVGSPLDSTAVNLGIIVGKELEVRGSLTYADDGLTNDFERVIELISSGVFDPSSIVTHEFPLMDIKNAFETALDKSKNSLKVHVIHK